MDSPWNIKHQPKRLVDVVGQDSVLKNLKEFVVNHSKKRKKAALIYGPVGCGKTSSVYALANELDSEILEINASDVRNKDAINSIVGSAAKQMSLFNRGKIILIDEIDELSGTEDRGGISALASFLDESAFPIILTAVDPFDQKLQPLRKKSELIKFNVLESSDVFKCLKRICEKESVKFIEDDLKALSHRSGSDLRAAVSDLQVLTQNTKCLERHSIDCLCDRNREETIQQALLRIFKSTKMDIAMNALENVDMNPEESMMWIDESLPKEYKDPEDLAKAYDALSKADVFQGRIRRWQHWRFLVYSGALMTAGVAIAKKSKYKEIVSYERTKRILKLWIAKQRYLKRRGIAEKIAEKTHCSVKRAIKDVHYYQFIFRKNRVIAEKISDYLKLDDEEVEWLRK